jgi:hypothetical protein
MNMKTCSRCKEEKPFDDYYRTKHAKDGRQAACKICMRGAYNSSRKKKQGHYQAIAKERYAKNTAKMREWKEERGCVVCKETFAPCLELHHLDPNEKERNPSEMYAHSFENFLKEAEKCVVLCANCHRKVHHGFIGL